MASKSSRRDISATASLRELEARVQKLEDFVFGQNQKKPSETRSDSFRGATGGLRFLIHNGFFDQKRAFADIKQALARHNYHYSKQAVQTPLNALSKSGSLLVSFREGGRKVYARRK
ncbi:MAG: hypothetical protein WA624_20560 [Methylocella sp.]